MNRSVQALVGDNIMDLQGHAKPVTKVDSANKTGVKLYARLMSRQETD